MLCILFLCLESFVLPFIFYSFLKQRGNDEIPLQDVRILTHVHISGLEVQQPCWLFVVLLDTIPVTYILQNLPNATVLAIQPMIS